MTIYKDIEYNGMLYKIGSDGTIFNIKTNKNIKGSIDGSGYRYLINSQKNIKFHRLIYYAFYNFDIKNKSIIIDHINRNKLDNRIDNLRIITQQENCWNTNAKGYSKHPCGKYLVKICKDYKQIHIGLFETEDEAKQAYLDAKEKYHNRFV